MSEVGPGGWGQGGVNAQPGGKEEKEEEEKKKTDVSVGLVNKPDVETGMETSDRKGLTEQTGKLTGDLE